MKRCLVFAHGFGFDDTYWARLRTCFEGESCVALSEFKPVAGVQYIGIGHSLGLIKLINSNIPFAYLIGLNGFVDFLGADPVLRLRRQAELARMSRQLALAPEKTLTKFYQRCGVDGDYPMPTNISADLALLQQTIHLSGQRVMIISAEDDVVVPPELIADNFQHDVRVEMLREGGHALGYVAADVICRMIIGFINETTDSEAL